MTHDVKELSPERKEFIKIMKASKPIADEIWRQMVTMDRNLTYCMGVSSLQVIPYGLRITVNGLSFKGKVDVVLNGGDLYDVTLRSPRALKAIRQIKDVYAEDLMPLLESEVENRSAK